MWPLRHVVARVDGTAGSRTLASRKKKHNARAGLRNLQHIYNGFFILTWRSLCASFVSTSLGEYPPRKVKRGPPARTDSGGELSCDGGCKGLMWSECTYILHSYTSKPPGGEFFY